MPKAKPSKAALVACLFSGLSWVAQAAHAQTLGDVIDLEKKLRQFGGGGNGAAPSAGSAPAAPAPLPPFPEVPKLWSLTGLNGQLQAEIFYKGEVHQVRASPGSTFADWMVVEASVQGLSRTQPAKPAKRGKRAQLYLKPAEPGSTLSSFDSARSLGQGFGQGQGALLPPPGRDFVPSGSMMSGRAVMNSGGELRPSGMPPMGAMEVSGRSPVVRSSADGDAARN